MIEACSWNELYLTVFSSKNLKPPATGNGSFHSVPRVLTRRHSRAASRRC